MLRLCTASTGLDVATIVGTGDAIGKRQNITKVPDEVLHTPKGHPQTTTTCDARLSESLVAGAGTVLVVLSDLVIWTALHLAL